MIAAAGERRWSSSRHIGLILAAGLVMRLYYHLAFRPWWAGDSSGYTYPMWNWANGYFPDGVECPSTHFSSG